MDLTRFSKLYQELKLAKESSTPAEIEKQKVKYVKSTLKETIFKNNAISNEEFLWLVNAMNSDENDELRIAAAGALASFAYPSILHFFMNFYKFLAEKIPGIRKLIVNNDVFHTILFYATNGMIVCHNEIKKSDVVLGEKIGQGIITSSLLIIRWFWNCLQCKMERNERCRQSF
jgi:hypothetical protein